MNRKIESTTNFHSWNNPPLGIPSDCCYELQLKQQKKNEFSVIYIFFPLPIKMG